MFLSEAGAGAPPFPVSEAAEHLRLGIGFADDGSEDALLARYLASAVAVIERRIAQALVSRRFELRVSHWSSRGDLVMPTGPVTALVEAFMETNSASTVLDVSGWTLSAEPVRQRLTASGRPLPPIPAGGSVRIVFEAGIAADWAGVPGDLRQAVLLLAAEFYERRGTEHVADQGLPGPVLGLLNARRPVRV